MVEYIRVSKITTEEISNANSKIDINKLDEVEFKYIAMLVLSILVLMFFIGIKKDEKEKKEVFRKKRLIDRKKKINIHLEKDVVNKMWEKILNENEIVKNE